MTTEKIEILIATMKRNDWTFLEKMFVHNKLSEHQILIINQTEKGIELHSTEPHIRVINSFEKGLSKSRNVALQNATGDICLIADDDVVFEPDFINKISKGFQQFKDADVVSFKTKTTKGNAYWAYPDEDGPMPSSKIRKILSVELAFRRRNILEKKVWFNEYFGLGAEFPNGANYLFLKDLTKKSAKICFYRSFICTHPPVSSSDQVGTDALLYAITGRNCYLYGKWAYVLLLKFVFYIWRKSYIDFTQIPHKLKVGYAGIKKFYSLKEKIQHFEPANHSLSQN